MCRVTYEVAHYLTHKVTENKVLQTGRVYMLWVGCVGLCTTLHTSISNQVSVSRWVYFKKRLYLTLLSAMCRGRSNKEKGN